jgi:urease accessory protein UreF
VLECLRALQNIRYNIPTYSSMRIGALNVGLHHNIGHYFAQLAENNVNVVVSLITYIQ